MQLSDMQLTRFDCSVKFGGGSVMVFGLILAAGPGALVRLHGQINALVYKELL